jgi:colanic acid biosynthesis glycosyl transferase WcaI
MLERAKNKGVDIARLIYFPNWVEVSDFSNKFEFNYQKDFRNKLSIPDKALVALYAGSMGAKQGLEIIAQVAHKFIEPCGASSPIHFILCGDGPGRLQLINQCAELEYVHFLDFQPIEALPELLLTADIHLLPQKVDVGDLVMPSKLTGMLASGRPVVASAQPGTELSDVVSRCGIVVPPENPHLFFEALLLLANDRGLRERLGGQGRAYAKEFIDKNSVLTNYENKLRDLVG